MFENENKRRQKVWRTETCLFTYRYIEYLIGDRAGPISPQEVYQIICKLLESVTDLNIFRGKLETDLKKPTC